MRGGVIEIEGTRGCTLNAWGEAGGEVQKRERGAPRMRRRRSDRVFGFDVVVMGWMWRDGFAHDGLDAVVHGRLHAALLVLDAADERRQLVLLHHERHLLLVVDYIR